MGTAGSKAAARSYNAVQQGAQRTTAAAPELTGSVAADAARATQHAQRENLTLEQAELLERRDQDLGGLLDRLGGAIQGKAVAIMPTQEELAARTPQLRADSSGRLPPEALKELLKLQGAAAGGPLQADHLLRKYKVDPQLVQAVLSRACAPDVVEAPGPGGVQAFAEWPPWFERQHS